MTAHAPRPRPALPPASDISSVYIPGMCGTAMGTLAAMLKTRGFRVLGSDPSPYPPMSDWLMAQGLHIAQGWNADNVPGDVDLVVVGNVCRRDNPEVLRAQALGLPCVSLPEALDHFFFAQSASPTLVVSGTHGKTTTSSIAAWLLEATGADPSFFIGGVTGHAGSSFRLGEGPFVIEGDEYDTAFFDKVPKFWHYPATHATINNIEFDHADIYPDLDAIRRVFHRFAEHAAPNGELWVNADDPLALEAARACRGTVRTFGLTSPDADLRAEVIAHAPDAQVVRILHADGWQGEVRFPLMGDFNVRNLLGALGLVWATGADRDVTLEAASRFRAVRKRQEWIGAVQGIDVYDDFAHHPTAVRETLAALRLRHPGRKLWAIFEAKSNSSRRAVFQEAWPDALSLADRVVLARPWRDDPLPEDQKLSLERVVTDLQERGVDTERFADVDDIVQHVAARAEAGDLIVGLSGSAFGGLHRKLVAALEERFGV